MNNKILSLLGFAAKAGRLGYGFDATVSNLKSGKAKLVITAQDISPKSKKEIEFFSNKFNKKHITLKGIDIQTISKTVGKRCGIVSVNDQGFADALLKAQLKGGFANDE